MFTKYNTKDKVVVNKGNVMLTGKITNRYVATKGNYYQVQYDKLEKNGKPVTEDVQEKNISKVYE